MTDNFGFIVLKDLPISRSTAYRLAKSELRLVKLGRHSGVLKGDWEKFLSALPPVGRKRSTRHAEAAAARWRKSRPEMEQRDGGATHPETEVEEVRDATDSHNKA